MSRDPRLFFEDIQESCLKILRYTEGLDFDAFCAMRKTKDAVVRNRTIIEKRPDLSFLDETLRIRRGERAAPCSMSFIQ